MPRDRPLLFIVDDNTALRATLRELFTDACIEVVGEAGDAAAALGAIPTLGHLGPLVVLMDVRMPGRRNGIEATRLLVERHADVRVVVFTAFPSPAIEAAAKRAGAVALLVKGLGGDDRGHGPACLVRGARRALSRVAGRLALGGRRVTGRPAPRRPGRRGPPARRPGSARPGSPGWRRGRRRGSRR